MKILPTLVVSTLISVILLTFYLKSNNESTKYICIEDKTSNYLFITLEKTNFFTRLISNKYDNLKYEFSSEESGLYSYSVKNEDELEIFKDDKSLKKGNFSLSNKNLFLKLKNRSFRGTCKIYKDHCVNNMTH